MNTPINGWIILDKPSGITSAHAVAKVKRILKPKKIGHAGTLDPLASGILPLALGEATKTVNFMMDAGKAYRFTVKWGEETDTDDSEGAVVRTSDKRPTDQEILALLPEFIGHIQQQPPNYSAIKVDGQRSYDLARAGEAVELKSREVRVDSLVYEGLGSFLCHCGKGTYIRSLARDMGRKFGSYGHITVLRRLKVGNFTENHAISLDMLEEMRHKGDLSFYLPVEAALDDIPAWNVSSDQASLLRRGMPILIPEYKGNTGQLLALCEGKAVAICEAANGSAKPSRVFNL